MKTQKQNKMQKIIIITIMLITVVCQSYSQDKLRMGLGYYGENVVNPGALIEFEYEKYFTDDFSLPLRADLGYHLSPDYHAFTLDIHKGFRKYFESGLILEQSIGLGIITKDFYSSNYWFKDPAGFVAVHGNKLMTSIMPSITAGIGYDFSTEKDHSSFLWIRPKVYWDLGYRGLNMPNAALQIGFTKTLKTK